MKVNEVFYSICGESTDAGRPCVFIRLTGCNLRCKWCDTQYAFREGKEWPVERIVAEVQRYGCKFICVTGGEPLNRNILPLIRELKRNGFEIQIETNGSKPIYEYPQTRMDVKWVLDIKTPSSGEEKKMDYKNVSLLKDEDELKFVVADKADFKWAVDIISTYHRKGCILFSPVFDRIELQYLAELVKDLQVRFPDKNIRMQLQMHKLIWDPKQRGV